MDDDTIKLARDGKLPYPAARSTNNIAKATGTRGEDTKDTSSGIVTEPQETTQSALGSSNVLISICLILAVFLVALDTTILSTAIPKITDTFESLTDVGWYGGVYSLTTAVFQLLFGKFYTIFSTKWTFLVSIGIFEVGSTLCGAAPVSDVLILGRALAGVGSAGIFAGCFIIISQIIPLRWRSLYTGIFGALYGVASVVGPVMGGILTDKLSWRWCFWINLPVGAITMFVMLIFFHPPEIAGLASQEELGTSRSNRMIKKLRQIDVMSTTILIAAIVSLLLALQWGGVVFSWKNGRIIALLIIAVLASSSFLYVQTRQGEKAFLPLHILRQRTVWACCWFSFFAGSSVIIIIYYLPIWFQAVKGVSALKSGFLNLPFVISLVITSLVAGALVSIVGYYSPFLILSSILRSIGAGLLTTLDPRSPPWQYILYQIIYGIGDGCGMQQPMIAVQTVLPQKDIPMGISVLIFLQTLGGAIFIAVGQSVFSGRLLAELTLRAPNVDANRIVKSGATAFRKFVSKDDLENVLDAYSEALTQTFLLAVALACMSLIGAVMVEWKKVKPKKDRKQSVAGSTVPAATAIIPEHPEAIEMKDR